MSGKLLEMGIGKGGDLLKWLKARVKELYGVGLSFTATTTLAHSLVLHKTLLLCPSSRHGIVTQNSRARR